MSKKALQKAVNICGGQASLARAIGVTQPNIWYWLNDGKHVPAEHCASIETATSGEVTRHDLRPDLFEQPGANAA